MLGLFRGSYPEGDYSSGCAASNTFFSLGFSGQTDSQSEASDRNCFLE